MRRAGVVLPDAVPLTYAQRFIYQVLTQLGAKVYELHVTGCLRITGPVDVARFARAADALVTRHPILGSQLELSGDTVLQRHGVHEPSFEVMDVGDAGRVDTLLSERAGEPFDLFRGSPFRVVVARTHAAEAFVLLSVHHIYADFASMQLMLEDYLELFLRDGADVTREPPNDDDRSYLSYARREQQMIHDGTFARRADYWVDYLDQADPALHLPDRRPDPALASWAPTPFDLDRESFQAVSDRARRLGVTPFALAVASMFHVLRETTGQDDLLLTVVMNLRRRPFERTVGDFAEFFIVRQRGQRSGLGDDAVRAVYQDIVRGMKNQLPFSYFADRLDWMKMRLARGYAVTEVNVNQRPVAADAARSAPLAGYEAAPFPLPVPAPPVPYHGIVLRWVFEYPQQSLSGFVLRESALVEPRAAQALTTSWLHRLSGTTHP